MSRQFSVIGSINMDLVSQVDRFPEPGETRTGKEFGVFPGGKGANQAVALARLGADVAMVGKVGDDVFGRRYREIFDAEGIDHEAVATEEGSNGVAAIQVNEAGENIIIYTPGANGTVDPAYLDSVRGSLGGGGNPGGGGDSPGGGQNPGGGGGNPGGGGRPSGGGQNPGGDNPGGGGSPAGGGRPNGGGQNPGGDNPGGGGSPGGAFFLFQLELPIKAVQRGLEICRASEGTSILDPAPAQELPASVLKLVDIITPNQGEAKLLTGVQVSDEETARQAADTLVSEGVGKVVIKAGADGAYVLSDGELTHVPGFSVDVKDTTAAGDSFNAGLAFALGRGDNVVDAARFACAVGALSTTAVGAQSGMPKPAAVQELIDEQG